MTSLTQTGRLTLTVVDVQGVEGADKPDAVIVIFGNGAELDRTRPGAQRKNAPAWNQTMFIGLENILSLTFDITDKDHLAMKGNHSIGGGTFPLPLSTELNYTKCLLDVSTGGAVLFHYTYEPATLEDVHHCKRIRSASTLSRNCGTQNLGLRRLAIKIISARNLMAKAPHGTTDAYCTIKVGNKKLRTSVIEKSINPEWNEAFVGEIDEHDSKIKITVIDVNNETFLGQVHIDLNEIATKPNGDESSSKWRELEKKSMRSKKQGMLLIDVYFIDPSTPLKRCGSLKKIIRKASTVPGNGTEPEPVKASSVPEIITTGPPFPAKGAALGASKSVGVFNILGSDDRIFHTGLTSKPSFSNRTNRLSPCASAKSVESLNSGSVAEDAAVPVV
eukprot:Ihof_evm1s671 gene=Ihof_evmTU1s671